MALLGVGQGLIAAPIIARVAAGGAAGAVGRDRTIAVYRILERIGHISGPALVGLLLVEREREAPWRVQMLIQMREPHYAHVAASEYE